MRRAGVTVCLLSMVAWAAGPEADVDADAPPPSTTSTGPHLQVTGALLGEFAGKAVGGELRASAGVGELVDLGVGATLGASTGLLLTARLHSPWEPHASLRPFVQARVALHPASQGYGGGLLAGTLFEAGPGRVELGVAGHLYSAAPGYLPYGVFVTAGYELDAVGTRPRDAAADAPTPAGEAPREAAVRELVGATLVRGTVHDVDDQPLPTAKLSLAGTGLRAPLRATGATFRFPVEAGEYTLTAEADGFYLRGVHVVVKRGEQLVFSLPLRPMAKVSVAELKDKRVELRQPIQFEANGARILPESFYLLDAVADVLLRLPRLKQVRVEGHTDTAGTEDFNQTLSEDRAAAVVRYLVSAGVDPVRLQAQGFGASKPVASNRVEAGRAKNRRIQFEIVE